MNAMRMLKVKMRCAMCDVVLAKKEAGAARALRKGACIYNGMFGARRWLEEAHCRVRSGARMQGTVPPPRRWKSRWPEVDAAVLNWPNRQRWACDPGTSRWKGGRWAWRGHPVVGGPTVGHGGVPLHRICMQSGPDASESPQVTPVARLPRQKSPSPSKSHVPASPESRRRRPG